MIDSNIYWQQLQNAPVQGKFNGLSHMLQSYGQGVDSHTAAVQRAELLARQKEAHAMQMQAFKDKQLAAQRKQAAIDSMNYNGPMARPLEERLMLGAAYAPQVAKTLAGLHEQFNPAPIQKIVDNQVVTMGANPTATPISGFTQEPKYQIIDGQYVPEQPGPQAFKVPGFTPKDGKSLVTVNTGADLSKDYMWVDPTDPSRGAKPVPGSAAARAIKLEDDKKEKGDEITQTAAQTVFADTRRALDLVRKYGRNAAGTWANATKFVSELPAGRLEAQIKSIQGNIGIDTLLKIKASGAGLGQVPQAQLEMLASVLGILKVGMHPEDLEYNLQRVNDIYGDVVRKTGGDPNKLYAEEISRLKGGGTQPAGQIQTADDYLKSIGVQ